MTQGFDVRYPSHPRSYQDTTDAQEVFEDILETGEVPFYTHKPSEATEKFVKNDLKLNRPKSKKELGIKPSNSGRKFATFLKTETEINPTPEQHDATKA